MLSFIKNNRRIITVSFELLVVIVTLIAATYAWYTRNKDVQNGDIIVTTNSYVDLYVSLDGGNTWTSNSSFNIPADFVFNNEVTGDGVNFYKATSKNDYGVPLSVVKAEKGKDYLEFNVLFKSTGDVAVFLQNTSFVNPAVGTESSDLIGNSSKNISSSGSFSRDLIAGGVRVSFTETDFIDGEFVPKNVPNLVWAPNKGYKVECNLIICDVELNSDDSQDYSYIDGGTVGLPTKYIKNLRDDLHASYTDYTAGGDPYITLINTSEDEEGNVEGIHAVTVRVWVEGNDRDTINALAGGEFVLKFDFVGLQKQIVSSVPEVTKSESILSGVDESMEYSLDRGLSWNDFDFEDLPEFSTGDIVCVRYKENDIKFASDYIIIEY